MFADTPTEQDLERQFHALHPLPALTEEPPPVVQTTAETPCAKCGQTGRKVLSHRGVLCVPCYEAELFAEPRD